MICRWITRAPQDGYMSVVFGSMYRESFLFLDHVRDWRVFCNLVCLDKACTGSVCYNTEWIAPTRTRTAFCLVLNCAEPGFRNWAVIWEVERCHWGKNWTAGPLGENCVFFSLCVCDFLSFFWARCQTNIVTQKTDVRVQADRVWSHGGGN